MSEINKSKSRKGNPLAVRIMEDISALHDSDRVALLRLLVANLPAVARTLGTNDQLRIMESLAVSAVRTIFGLRSSVRIKKSGFVWSTSAPDFSRTGIRNDEFDPDRVLVRLEKYLCEILSAEYAVAGFEHVARESREWPVQLGYRALSATGPRDLDSAEHARELLERLPLARSSPVRFDSNCRHIQRSTPRNQAVLWHLDEMLAYWHSSKRDRLAIKVKLCKELRRNNAMAACGELVGGYECVQASPTWDRWHSMVDRLPPLGPDSVEAWFDAMWVKINDEYNGRPEEKQVCEYPEYSHRPDLSRLGVAERIAAVREKRGAVKIKTNVMDQERLKAIDSTPYERRAARGAVKGIKKALLAAMRTLVGRQGPLGAEGTERRRPKRGPAPTGVFARRPARSLKKRL
jgi:hypothetical protein